MIYIKPSNGATMDCTVDQFKAMPDKLRKRWRKATEAEIEAHKADLKKKEIAEAKRQEREQDIEDRNQAKKDDKASAKSTGKNKGKGGKKEETAKGDDDAAPTED